MDTSQHFCPNANCAYRGWVDWGQGAIGDMGAHLIDHPFRALDLGMPTVIETVSTPFNGLCYPTASLPH